jgi:CBS domain containing-hemolysin-like protein
MSTNVITPQEKKIKDLRKILTACFIGITLSIILLASLPMFLIDTRASQSIEGTPIDALLTILVVGLLVLIGITGVVCLVIYYIFKYRLEKEDELFL